MYDPRCRAFPWGAHHQPALIRTREYLTAYNASPNTCDVFWGHLGRNVTVRYRFRPAIYRISFIAFATCAVLVGYFNTLFCKAPNVFEDILKNPGTIRKEDIVQALRLVKIWQGLIYPGFWLTTVALIYGMLCITSIIALSVRTVWNYVPEEERERIVREIREQERIREEGRIRLQ